MTCNTSAVAVCCSSASRVSVKSRAFSIAMTACAAKFCSSAISFSENGRTSRTMRRDVPEERIVLPQWHEQQGAGTGQFSGTAADPIVRVVSTRPPYR